MSDQVQKMGFGVVDDNDDSLKSKTGGVFGLNSGVFFTKIAYNANAGTDGAAGDAVDINVKIGDRDYNGRIYDITGDLYNAKEVLVKPDEEGYNALYNAELKQRMAVVLHAVKATGVTKAMLDTALATPLPTFADWARVVTALIPTDYTTKAIDFFLQYQWKIKEGQTRTFLEMAKNMKGGRFLCATVASTGNWTPVIDENGLRYVDEKNGEHPFTRNANFMKQPKSYAQVEGEENGPDGNTSNANFQEADKKAATKATW